MSAEEPPTYSNVVISEVQFNDEEDILNPFPPTPLGGPHPGVDPQELVNPSAPPNGDSAYVAAVHAIDPRTGPPIEDTPFNSPETALSTIIGLRVLEPGREYEDVGVPIFVTPQFAKFEFTFGEAEQFPPNPTGQTEVAVTLWYNTNPGLEFEFNPSPITSGGQPIVANATIAVLDQNDDEEPISEEPAT